MKCKYCGRETVEADKICIPCKETEGEEEEDEIEEHELDDDDDSEQ